MNSFSSSNNSSMNNSHANSCNHISVNNDRTANMLIHAITAATTTVTTRLHIKSLDRESNNVFVTNHAVTSMVVNVGPKC